MNENWSALGWENRELNPIRRKENPIRGKENRESIQRCRLSNGQQSTRIKSSHRLLYPTSTSTRELILNELAFHFEFILIVSLVSRRSTSYAVRHAVHESRPSPTISSTQPHQLSSQLEKWLPTTISSIQRQHVSLSISEQLSIERSEFLTSSRSFLRFRTRFLPSPSEQQQFRSAARSILFRSLSVES